MSEHLLNSINAFVKNVSAKKHNDMVCKLAGVTFGDRQKHISKLAHYTTLRLVREKDNEFDENAIRVEALIENDWFDIGFIPKTLNKELAHLLDSNRSISANIISIYGDDNTPIGVRIGIQLH